jgi:hypothetical protein
MANCLTRPAERAENARNAGKVRPFPCKTSRISTLPNDHASANYLPGRHRSVRARQRTRHSPQTSLLSLKFELPRERRALLPIAMRHQFEVVLSSIPLAMTQSSQDFRASSSILRAHRTSTAYPCFNKLHRLLQFLSFRCASPPATRDPINVAFDRPSIIQPLTSHVRQSSREPSASNRRCNGR